MLILFIYGSSWLFDSEGETQKLKLPQVLGLLLFYILCLVSEVVKVCSGKNAMSWRQK